MLDKTTVITFSGSSVHKGLQDEFHNKYDHLFKNSIKYTGNDLKKTSFYKKNQEVFGYSKYFGYFAWKPYVIKDALKKNEYVLYCDSNVLINKPDMLDRFFSYGINKEDIFIPKYNHYPNYEWTKRDTFILMDLDNRKYWNSYQVWTSIMGFRRTPKILALLDEYEAYCLDERIITELPNTTEENLPGFKEHRWEQSVMSLLVEKHGITGVLYNDILSVVDKFYPEELVKLKAEVNKTPLAKEE